MAVNEQVLVNLRAIGQAVFSGEMDKAAEAIGNVSDAAGDADQAVSDAADSAEKSTPSWSKLAVGLAKVVAASAALVTVKKVLEDSINASVDLAKSTAGLQRITGLDARTASGWVSIAKERGIETNTLNKSFIVL